MSGASESETLLAQIETDLGRPRSRIAFSADIESLYWQATEPTRVRHFSIIILLVLVMFDLFIFPERLIMPDTHGVVTLFYLGIVTPSVLCTLWLLRRRTINAASTAMFFLSIVIVAVLFTTMSSRAPQAILMAFCLPMILIFCTVLPLSFRWALWLALEMTLVVSVLITCHPSFDNGTRLMAAALTCTITICTLLATYRLETSERRSFLLTLAETTRTKILADGNRVLRDLSNSDGLTGIGNRRLFDATLERLWIEHAEAKTPLALVMIDIDHFKRLNDVHGHLAGDRCLRAVAAIADSFTRENVDFAFRYGGDEFVILLGGSDGHDAARFAEKCRVAINGMASAVGEDTGMFAATASIGHAAIVPDLGTNPAALITEADQALYIAKQNGRDRIYPGLLRAVPGTPAQENWRPNLKAL